MSFSVNRPCLGKSAVLPLLHPHHLSSSVSLSLPAHNEPGIHCRGGLCGAATGLNVFVRLGSILGQWQAQAAREDEHCLSLLLAFSAVAPPNFCYL